MREYIFKKGKITIIILIASIVIATVLQVMAFALPTGPIIKNVKKSIKSFEAEGKYREIIPGINYSMLDNFTDACMIAGATYNGKEALHKRAMNVYTWQTVGGIVNGVDHYDYYQSLINECKGIKAKTAHPYFWYWHGYIVVLKPLLLFFNYNNIRILNMFGQLMCLITLVVLLFRRGFKDYILPFAVGYILMIPVTVCLSLQFSACYYMMLLSSIVLLKWKEYFEKGNNYWIVFLITGIGTSFFDLLTYPIVTLGTPLIIYFIMNKEDSFKKMMGNLLEKVAFWGIGYVVFWIGKWGIASLLLHENCFVKALSKINQHTSMDASGLVEKFTVGEVLRRGFVWIKTPMLDILVVAAFIYLIVKLIKSHGASKKGLKLSIPLFIVSLFPVMWFVFASSHVYFHYWMEYRSCFVLIFGVLAALVKMRKEDKTDYQIES